VWYYLVFILLYLSDTYNSKVHVRQDLLPFLSLSYISLLGLKVVSFYMVYAEI